MFEHYQFQHAICLKGPETVFLPFFTTLRRVVTYRTKAILTSILNYYFGANLFFQDKYKFENRALGKKGTFSQTQGRRPNKMNCLLVSIMFLGFEKNLDIHWNEKTKFL